MIKSIKFFLLYFLIAIFFYSNTFVFSLAENSEETSQINNQTTLEERYISNKEKVQSQLDSISSELDSIAESYRLADEQATSLNDSIVEKRGKLNEIDNLILDTRLIVGQLDKQIEDNQKQIENINSEISKLNLEIQKRTATNPIKILFTSENLGLALGEIFSFDSMQDKVKEKKQEIDKANQRIKETKEQNLLIKEELEKTRGLLRSEEASLEILLSKTQGQEDRYQELLNSISQQKKELEADLNGLSGEYIAELASLRSEEARRNSFNTDCEFEVGSLEVPPGYFASPAKGFMTQEFHCGHDGVDIANNLGTPLTSIADGEVVRIGPKMDGCVGLRCNGGFGNYIVVKHVLPNQQKVYSLYAHMHRPTTKLLGQRVQKGEEVGLMGCTGYTIPFPCGVHIHFVMLSDSYETAGIACRLGGATCYNPQKYIDF